MGRQSQRTVTTDACAHGSCGSVGCFGCHRIFINDVFTLVFNSLMGKVKFSDFFFFFSFWFLMTVNEVKPLS